MPFSPASGASLPIRRQKRSFSRRSPILEMKNSNRYMNAEKRVLIQGVENLWDKYAVSSSELESGRAGILKVLDGFIDRLGYLEGAPQ